MRLGPGTRQKQRARPLLGSRPTPGAGRKRRPILTCPIFFKATQEVESHHDEGVQGNESYVHLKQEGNANAIAVRTLDRQAPSTGALRGPHSGTLA